MAEKERHRVLFVHHVSSIGGGSYCLLNIIKGLDRSLFEPIVLLCENGTLVDELKKLDVEVVYMPSLTQIPYNHSLIRKDSIKAYYRVFQSFSFFESMLKDESIDIVYLNNMMISPYLIPSKKCGCKTVLHVREHWPLNDHKKQLEWLRKIVKNNCDLVVAINKYSASIFPDNKPCVVYDWIDFENRYKKIPFSEIFGEDMSGKKVLLFTGGLDSRMKGADYVINAFANEIKGDEYRLLILGGVISEPKWKRKIKQLLLMIGIDRGVRMRNTIQSDYRIKCVPSVYELAHIIEQSYCFVSYFRVPHANLALAENIILGNPCIAADTEEAREYTGDGQYARLVAPNKPDVFAKELKLFLNNIDYWKEKAIEGKPFVATLFDKTENIKRLNSSLISIVKDKEFI